ncbi:E3 ubiquitin-protein ligase DTX3L-like [Arapaima gigas]
MDAASSPSREVRRIHGKVLVDFQLMDPQHDELQCHNARERFIAFYQKIATNLQRKIFDVEPTLLQQHKDIKSRFPELLISDSPPSQTGNSCIMVTGNYADLMWFEQFLKNGMASSQRVMRPEGHPPRRRYSEMPGVSAKEAEQKVEEQSCPICLDVMKKTHMKTLARCQHSFCQGCLKKAFDSKPICPVCGVVYGQLQGTQPQNGTMEMSTSKVPLPGYPMYGSIIIRYKIPSGIQGEEHPSPGHSYEGASRVAFLPNSPEGRKVAKLLKRAFDQRLIFTIGSSSSTGRNNVVTWNDIHHKTSREGGPTNYGYPDPDYLSRVQEELKAKGIY